jgi:hypothetical protein
MSTRAETITNEATCTSQLIHLNNDREQSTAQIFDLMIVQIIVT